MADNLYDFLNRFTLRDAARLGRSGLQAATDALNRSGIGLGRKAQAATPKPSGKPAFVPISSDQLPAGAFMRETGRVGGMTSADAARLGGYMDEMGRVFVPPGMGSVPSAPQLPPPVTSPAGTIQPGSIVTGLDRGGEVDRRKSDTYKQYAQTPEGQFERYFQTPEMDQYFGAASRGKGAPADVGQMKALAGELTAPQDVPLSSYYRAQSALGRAQMPEIQKGLGYEEGSDLAKWAAANPMLAQRLYAKKQAAAPTETPAFPGYQAGAQPMSDIDSFSMAANSVPAPWDTQGEKVSGEFAGVVPFQAAKTTGEGMPAFQTTSEKAAEFLKRPGITTLF